MISTQDLHNQYVQEVNARDGLTSEEKAALIATSRDGLSFEVYGVRAWMWMAVPQSKQTNE